MFLRLPVTFLGMRGEGGTSPRKLLACSAPSSRRTLNTLPAAPRGCRCSPSLAPRLPAAAGSPRDTRPVGGALDPLAPSAHGRRPRRTEPGALERTARRAAAGRCGARRGRLREPAAAPALRGCGAHGAQGTGNLCGLCARPPAAVRRGTGRPQSPGSREYDHGWGPAGTGGSAEHVSGEHRAAVQR